MIVQDSQTILLGGMLFQEDSRTNRKVPFLGDLPLIGFLFRHKQDVEANSELLIFVTPYVIEAGNQMQPQALQEFEKAKRKLHKVQNDLKPLAQEDEPPEDSNSPDPLADVKLTPRDKTKETGSNSPAPAVGTPAPDAKPAPDDKPKEMNSGSPAPAVGTLVPDAKPVPGDQTKPTDGSSPGRAVGTPDPNAPAAPGDKKNQTK
jgi:hypothetical protein